MKKEDLKELLLKSVTDDLSVEDRSLLTDKVIPGYSFSSSFSENVMGLIEGAGRASVRTRDLFAGWNNTFLKVALTGAAAIIVLAVSLFVSQGSLSYDTLLGLDSSIDEGLVSLLTK